LTEPLIEPGSAGKILLTESVVTALIAQLLTEYTLIFPEVKLLPNITLIDVSLVIVPATNLAPAGRVQT
jgi:hypothetical protein